MVVLLLHSCVVTSQKCCHIIVVLPHHGSIATSQ